MIMNSEKLQIEVIRSRRRKKTVQAKLENRKLIIYIPAGLGQKEESELIEKMTQKVEKKQLRKKLNGDEHLEKRFNELNNLHFKGQLKIASIKYVTNQNTRRGSCSPHNGTIRISHRLAEMPGWVLDYVIMHEMTHLLHPDHSKRFWNKVNEYKYTERAKGFLICRGMDENDDLSKH